MSNEFIDILEPVEGEAFFSWMFRMIKAHSSRDTLRDYSETSKKLFFNDSRKPDLFWPDNIDKIIEKCNLPESEYLSSFSSVIEKMTNIPFYIDVCYGEKVRFDTCDEYKDFYRRNKYSPYTQDDITFSISFCPECLKETDAPVFYREHQIKGNKVCWKHGCALKYVNYEKKWSVIKLFFDSSFTETAKPYLLTGNEFAMATSIAETIHDIVVNGMNENQKIIYKKMAQKLFYDDKTICARQYSFSDCFDLSFKKLISGFYLNDSHVSIFRDLYEFLYYKQRNSSFRINDPIFLISCICRFWGSAKNMYAYELIEREPLLNCDCKVHSLNYYEDTLSADFFSEYDVLGTYQDLPIVRHKICGNCNIDYFDNLHQYTCPLCKEKILSIDSGEYVFIKRKYIDKKSFKSRHQINDSCLNYLINNSFLNSIDINPRLKLLPDDFILTEEIKSQLEENCYCYFD